MSNYSLMQNLDLTNDNSVWIGLYNTGCITCFDDDCSGHWIDGSLFQSVSFNGPVSLRDDRVCMR